MSSAPAIVEVIEVTGQAMGLVLWLNQSAERSPGASFGVYAFQSEIAGTTFTGADLHRAFETVDFIIYQGGGRSGGKGFFAAQGTRPGRVLTQADIDAGITLQQKLDMWHDALMDDPGMKAITCMQEFLQRLGPALSAMSGLETGVTEHGYHFARRRLTINPHRARS